MSGPGSGSMGPPKPPPRKKSTAAFKKGLAKITNNEERVKELRADALESRFFDSSSPQTQARRSRARTAFEEYVEAIYPDQSSETEDIWNSATFIQRTKEFLGAMVDLTTGRLGDKVKAGSLWQLKHGLYWWASVLMEDFNIIWQKWHEEVSRHIHYLAVKYGLGTASYAKYNLSDPELALIFRFIMQQDYGVANLKQHWAAMLLAWITGSRPGSFTVSHGYSKGTSLGVAGKFRETDETMRWSDLKFVRMPLGIACQVTFRFHKGYRNPHKEKAAIDSSRTFTLLPTTSERLEFDLSLILFALAYERGLFGKGSLEEIWAGDEEEISVDPEVNKQAVFVASNQAGTLEVNKPMPYNALNTKLQQLCVSIGLTARNTYYSFRRSAIIETRRKHGTEAAKDIAFHKPEANSLFFYDNVGMGDKDITAMRLGVEAGMSREEVKDFFAQYRHRIDISSESGAAADKENLKNIIEKEVRDSLKYDEEYVEGEKAHAALLDEGSTKLAELQEAGNTPVLDNAVIPTGYSAQKSGRITELLTQSGENELAKKITDGAAQRNLLHKRIRRKLQKEIRERMGKEQRALLKKNTSSARQVVNSKGYQPKNVTAPGAIDLGDSTDAALATLAETPDEDSEEEQDVDEEVLEKEDAANARQEPESWEGLPENVQIQIGSPEDLEAPGSEAQAEARAEVRLTFLKDFVNHADSDIPLSGLTCPLCAIDPTVKAEDKLTKWTLSKLDYHVTGKTHTREEQLKRAIKADGVFPVICPDCKFPFKDSRAIIKHIRVVHPEQLWLNFDDDDEEDEEDDDEETDDGEDDHEDDSTASYVGKGKGRAA
ncbi:unnamed protein product [Alternaria alternata]